MNRDYFDRIRRRTQRGTVPVRVGDVVIGGGAPVVVQTMTNTDTLDTAACAAQIERIAAAGCRMVRLTAQGPREAENLRNIAAILEEKGLRGPSADPSRSVALAADIHFSPDVALIAAEYVDKVRINPGNYRDPSGDRFLTLLRTCRDRGTAVRIGVNHGSLAPHVVERFGDTPQGMVESAMEFLRTALRERFDQIVVSMKSSNVRVMVHAYRLLVAAMEAEEMRFPLHLGVTEAGDGLDGRVKSAAGIAALLADGIGDTIRVSLTEPPENEIPVARAIIAYMEGKAPLAAKPESTPFYSPCAYLRRESNRAGRLGGGQIPLLYTELNEEEKSALDRGGIAALEGEDGPSSTAWRDRILEMTARGDRRPVILAKRYNESALESLCVKAACDFGMPFLDGLADGIRIENEHPAVAPAQIEELSLAILQATRTRVSRTEYIACPGCGRTLYDLETTLAAIRSRTNHLKGLKIGVMGCIVNGPGEMADADYGYVGSSPGRVTLYKGKEVIRKNIPQAEALDALIDLIRAHGDWAEPD